MNPEIVDTLTIRNNSKIIFLIMDGLGGVPNANGYTELETAKTPNLDALTKAGICGLLNPVGYGITPGSGPAHFALFGYDPFKNSVGRGLLEAAGIDYQMTATDLCVRINFASLNKDGIITDRRAGRIDTATNARICEKLQQNIKLTFPKVDFFLKPVRDHRALLVLRGDNLIDKIIETDPQQIGSAPFA
ncbi:MAG: phosphoglycerate mutase, partial [Deltaproteobacteria bacterium]